MAIKVASMFDEFRKVSQDLMQTANQAGFRATESSPPVGFTALIQGLVVGMNCRTIVEYGWL